MKRSIMVLAAGLLFSACHKSDQFNVQQQANQSAQHPATAQKSNNGVQGATTAYYDSVLFTINLKELPADVAANLIAHNKGINTIYEMESGETDVFVAVLDAIQKDGFNPLWREVEISFNPGFTPRQFFRDDEVLAAAASGEITLTTTNEMYRCSVIGKK